MILYFSYYNLHLYTSIDIVYLININKMKKNNAKNHTKFTEYNEQKEIAKD